MLRLSNVLYVAILFITTLSMSSCGFSAGPINSIPSDALMVGTMDVKQLMEKADFEAIKQMDFYKDMLAKAEREAPEIVAFLQDPKEAGISLDGNFATFLKLNPDNIDGEPLYAVMLPIADVAKLEESIKKAQEKKTAVPETESKGGYQLIAIDGTNIAWSSKLLAMTNMQGEELDKLFSPDKDKSIQNNKNFKKHLAEKKDAMFWITSDPIAKAIKNSKYSRDLSGVLLLMQLSNQALENNSISAYYNFEKGSMEGGAHFDFNEKLREEFGIVLKDKVETDFTKYMPAEGLMSMGALGIDLEGVEKMLAKRMLNMPIDMALGEVGLSLKKLAGGLDGELAFASYADTSSIMGQSIVFALGIKDKKFVDKLLGLVEDTGAKIEKNGNRLTITPPAMTNPIDPSLREELEEEVFDGMEGLEDLANLGMTKIEAVITDDALVFSTKAGVLDKVAAGGYAGAEAANNEYIQEALSGWAGVYYNYEGFLNNMADVTMLGTPGLVPMGMNPMSSIMLKIMAKYNEFTHAVTVFKGHDTYGKVYMKTTDKNSLKRMMEIANDAYKNRAEIEKEINKAMEEAMKKYEEEIKEEMEEMEKENDINI